MKLPKCPHCEKLLVAIITGGVVIASDGSSSHQQSLAYICPEKMDHRKPDWVEVLEI